MKRAIALCMMLSVAAVPSAAQQPTETESTRIVEFFFNDPAVTPDMMKSTLLKVYNGIGVDGFKFEGKGVSIQHTKFRVGSHRPPCVGDLDAQTQIGQALAVGGGAMLGASAAGGPGAPVIAAIGAAIATVGAILAADPQQTNSNCSLACTAVAGHYDDADLRSKLRVQFLYSKWGGAPFTQFTPGSDGEYFYASDWELRQVDLPIDKASELAGVSLVKHNEGIGQPPDQGLQSCPVTLVCSQIRNWSHTRDQSLQVVATLDRDHVASGACLDPTLVNKDLYADNIVKALPAEYVDHYYQAMAKRARMPPQ
ncbi:hypothetical protein ASD79_16405 [Caulobacter sp. Root655]|uniref:hypothetical protein n=1 Tax=Caulobacter sp. Root655 TaxID=1736578 RepID=UPI0006FD6138|nr:hypothetical protein [Caulobacter sp. Root655]KRA56649.1 hypothetical protein ASD79_16405 [Caulobacter sp. Root655]